MGYGRMNKINNCGNSNNTSGNSRPSSESQCTGDEPINVLGHESGYDITHNIIHIQ